MGKKISLMSIAEELGLSPTTVSFVINGHAKEKRISEEVVRRVSDFVDKIGYRPNSLARSFRTGKTNIIGLMVEDMSNGFFSAIARFIEEKSYLNGYKIIYSSTDNDTGKTKELLKMYEEWHVDGYIIVPPMGIEDDINFLIQSGKPVVQIDRYLSVPETDAVVTNNFDGAYQAATHLIEGGYKNIALITIEALQHQIADRISGYKKALEYFNFQESILKINMKVSIEDQITSFLQNQQEIDALLFSTNYLCIAGLKSIKQLNLKIPNQIGVVSFDDHELFELHTPTITAISQPIEQIAEHTINLLLSRLKNPNTATDFNQIVLPNTLIIRPSSIKS